MICTCVVSTCFSEEIVGRPHLVCPSLSDAMGAIQAPPLAQEIESVFILGGENVYKVVMLNSCWLHYFASY